MNRCSFYTLERDVDGDQTAQLCGFPAEYLVKGWSLCEGHAEAFLAAGVKTPYDLKTPRKENR